MMEMALEFPNMKLTYPYQNNNEITEFEPHIEPQHNILVFISGKIYVNNIIESVFHWTLPLFFLSPKEINRQNLEDVNNHVVLGEGVFGICYKKIYRGITVAVKQFKDSASLTLVKREASILAKMEHPGNSSYSDDMIDTCASKHPAMSTILTGFNKSYKK